jgi:hypothetical protein
LLSHIILKNKNEYTIDIQDFEFDKIIKEFLVEKSSIIQIALSENVFVYRGIDIGNNISSL